MIIKRIENIKELIDNLDKYLIMYLVNDLKFHGLDITGLSDIEVKKLLKKKVEDEDFIQYSNLEEFVYMHTSLKSVVFDETYMLDIAFRNRCWTDVLYYLFDWYEIDYVFDYMDESFELDIMHQLAFIRAIGIPEDLFCPFPLNSLFYYEFEDMILRFYNYTIRKEKLEKLKERISQ